MTILYLLAAMFTALVLWYLYDCLTEPTAEEERQRQEEATARARAEIQRQREGPTIFERPDTPEEPEPFTHARTIQKDMDREAGLEKEPDYELIFDVQPRSRSNDRDGR